MATTHTSERPTCPLDISGRTLSALRDDALSTVEAGRITAHAETCAACRERLSAYAALAALLRTERPPEPDARLWRAFAAAAAAREHSPRSRRQPWRRSDAGRLYSSMVSPRAVAALLLVIGGFAALLVLRHPASPAQPLPTATPSPSLPTLTPSPLPSATPGLLAPHLLTWQPTASSASNQGLGAIQPAGNGESAYACAVGSDGHGNSVLQIWRTSDRGATWSAAREVPSQPTANGCSLVVDASDPSVAALAWAPRGGGAGDAYTGLMTTVDGGSTWQAAPADSLTRIDQLDSRDGVIFALRETVDSANSVAYHLWASDDRMQTWRQIDRGLPADVAGFWLRPDGAGILLVLSGGAAAAPSQLWTSPDGGATWRQLTVPGGIPAYTPAGLARFGSSAIGIVARSIQGQFHICISDATAGTSTPQMPVVECSTDSGQSWQARTMLTLNASNGVPVSANLVDMTDDGTLLASGFPLLYRLAAGSGSWQSLGTLPQPLVSYCPTPGLGLLWAVPEATGTGGNPQNQSFTATYTT